jgi:hypothetical protein
MSETVLLYRPCNQAEWDLVVESGYRRWPPRLPMQPIFYPVTNPGYAWEIHRWNMREYGNGYVTQFAVEKVFMDRYEIQTVGAANHTEWWIPAEDLEAMNDHIVGLIELVPAE